ncbi:hypothetical protein D3C87_1452390 [compost metagenome]
MYKVLFVILLVGLGQLSNAEDSSKNVHKHVHARISIAFDGKQGKIIINAPAEMIYGFETQARSAKDRKLKDQGLLKLDEKIAEAVVLDPALQCEIRKDMFEVNQEDKHADVEADFRVTCQSAAAGSTIQFNPRKVFSRFKSLNVEVMADSFQKSVTITKDGETIGLQSD